MSAVKNSAAILRETWHRRTDPACRVYRAPRTRFQWWHFNRSHGKGCLVCIRLRAAERGAA